MNEPTPGRIEVEAILTTDQPVEAYGGIRLSVEALHQLADQVMQPGAEMVLNHDRTRPLNASNVHAEVRWNERGWHEVVMVFEADAAAWAEFEAEKKALGAPGGMSFSTCAPLATGGTGDRPVVRIAADAHHFSPADLEEAGCNSSLLWTWNSKSYFSSVASHPPRSSSNMASRWRAPSRPTCSRPFSMTR